MIKGIGGAFALGVWVLLFSAAFAADERQQPFPTLIGKGFKIVATAFLPSESRTDKIAVLVVTLQLDKSVAVCTYKPGSWENLEDAILQDAKACDVRSY
jgi:hypothetical protein